MMVGHSSGKVGRFNGLEGLDHRYYAASEPFRSISSYRCSVIAGVALDIFGNMGYDYGLYGRGRSISIPSILQRADARPSMHGDSTSRRNINYAFSAMVQEFASVFRRPCRRPHVQEYSRISRICLYTFILEALPRYYNY
jgi:hypothetical protein